LINLDDGTLSIEGPSVQFVLDDNGRANVAIGVLISDGTSFHYPSGEEKPVKRNTVLAKGRHKVTVMVTAVTHEDAFGLTYDSSLRIGGTLVAAAQGDIDPQTDGDSDFQVFFLEVR